MHKEATRGVLDPERLDRPGDEPEQGENPNASSSSRWGNRVSEVQEQAVLLGSQEEMISKLKIGYQNYRIEPHIGMDVSGDTDVDKGIIRYDSEEVGLRHFNTLLHEVLHAVCDQMALDLDDDLEERVVAGLSNGLTMIVADNPGIGVALNLMLKPSTPCDSA